MKHQNRIISIPLFWKFAIVSTIVVAIFGSVNIFMLWSSVYKSFEQEIDKRCKLLAKIVSDKSLNPIVYDDNLSLFNLLDEIKQSDPSISYIFIINNANDIIAQTYASNIPDGLLDANVLESGNYNIKVIEANNFKYPVIRDIAYPILNGEIGTVRLGIAEEHIRQEMIKATTNMAIMIFAFFIFGLVGALGFSYIITSPIKKISQKAQVIDLSYIESETYTIENPAKKGFLNLHVNDEMDVLVTKFSEMLNRLKNSYIDLKEAQGGLVQTEKLASLGTVSAGVAHEINNPISGMKNCINRIIKNPENIKQNVKYIHLIQDATNSIENVVQRLLKFSRKQDIAFDVINLNSVIDSAILLTKHRLETKRISIAVDHQENHFVYGSANHLEQVFVNLILNSLDAILERREIEPKLLGKIDIRVNRNADKVFFSLSDNGIGISEEIQDKIFDPFFTSKEVGKGTGLGLSVSFNLIKEHKGKIHFKGSEGSGTEFIIELPIHENK